MVSLLGLTQEELNEVALEVGLPRFAGRQLAEWLYKRRVSSFDAMTSLSLRGREALKQCYTIGRHAPVAQAQSEDGTRKYLFQVGGQCIEAVFIPEEDRATLCVSTQAGCKMGCRFCMTGTLGFHGQLEAAEILNQIFSIPEAERLTNIVYMGEGEPMDNLENVLRSLQVMTAPWGCAWSPKRITVSSVGLPEELRLFLRQTECHLAISLHNPFHTERQSIMPIERVQPVAKTLALLREYDWSHQRRVSIEYICWHGWNDTPKHAQELLRVLRGLNCRVNLIRFHAGVEQAFPDSDEAQMEWLRDYLTQHGITTTIRRSRGEDILAACGMLVNALQYSKE